MQTDSIIEIRKKLLRKIIAFINSTIVAIPFFFSHFLLYSRIMCVCVKHQYGENQNMGRIWNKTNDSLRTMSLFENETEWKAHTWTSKKMGIVGVIMLSKLFQNSFYFFCFFGEYKFFKKQSKRLINKSEKRIKKLKD